MSFTSLVKFVPTYFILFEEIMNGIFFFISLFDSLWLLYKYAADFCTLILYEPTLLHLFILIFLVESLGFSMYCVIYK